MKNAIFDMWGHLRTFNMASQQQTDKTPHQGQHSKKPYGGF